MPSVWTISDPDLGDGRVGVAPGTVMMVIPPNGSPQILGAPQVTPGWVDGKPVAPGVPALPSQWQAAPYMGYLPVWKGWLTPGFGGVERHLGDFPVGADAATAPSATDATTKLQIRTILGVAVGSVLAGLVSYASLKAAGVERAWAGGLVAGGGAALIGGGLAVMLSWAEGAPTMQESVMRAALPVGVALAR